MEKSNDSILDENNACIQRSECFEQVGKMRGKVIGRSGEKAIEGPPFRESRNRNVHAWSGLEGLRMKSAFSVRI